MEFQFIILIYMISILATIAVTAIIGRIIYGVIKRKITKVTFQGKTVWITGAASGIGEQMAYEFSRAGASLILSDLSLDGLKKVKDTCANSEKVTIVKMDMSNFQEIEKTTEDLLVKLEKDGNKIDVVVENAGISMRSQFVDFSFENHLKMIAVNLNGPLKHLKSILPHMVKHKSGHVVGISSTAAKLGFSLRTSYSASKHGIVGALDTIRAEVTRHNIHVSNLMPGYVKTNVSKNALTSVAGQTFGKVDTNIGQGMEPEVFAKWAVYEIFVKNPEAVIADNWLKIRTVTILRHIWAQFVFDFMAKQSEKQLQAIANAKQD